MQAVFVAGWIVAAAAVPAAAEPVVWKHVLNASASGSTLVRSSARPLWDAGGVSTKAIAGGDGYFEFRASDTSTFRMAGLSHGDSGQGWPDIDFAVYLSGEDALVYVHEGSVSRGSFGSYAAGDTFRVEVTTVSGQPRVRYVWNGSVFYTSTVAPTYPLLADASLYTPGARITDAVLSGTLVDSGPMDLSKAGARLVWRNSDGQLLAWLLNGTEKSGEATMQPAMGAGWNVVGVADFNADRKADFLLHQPGSYVGPRYMDGVLGSGGGYATAPPDSNWQAKAAGEFNGDGKPDVVWRHATTGSNAVWYMDGENVIGSASLAAVADPAWDIVGTADFDRDGDTDLLWRHGTSGQNRIWLMSGAAPTGTVELQTLADTDWKVVGTGDVNEDGSVDIFWWNAATGSVRVWLINATGFLSAITLPSLADTNWRPVGYLPAQRTATPILSPPGGAYSVPSVDVVVSCAIGSVVRYTTTGAEPTVGDASVACGGTVPVTGGATTLTLRAWHDVFLPSVPVAATYHTGQIPPSTFSPNGGAFTNTQTVIVTSSVADASLHYTLTGAEPTLSAPSVSSGGTIAVGHDATLRVKAFRSGLAPSDTASASFTFSVAAPRFTPAAGAFAIEEEVTLSTETSSATIRYTLDGSEPGESSTLYAGPIRVTAATTIKAKAFRSGWPSSPVTAATYTPAGPTSEAVTAWRNKVNVTFEGANTFYKSGGGDGAWDAGASSVKAIAGGYGYVQFTAGGPLSEDEEGNRTFANVAVGLSNGDSHRSYTDIDFGIVLASNETVNVVVNGAPVWGGWGAWYGAGDRFAVEVTSANGQPRVNFYQNDGLIYTTNATPVYPLLVDTSIASTWGYVRNVTLYGVLTTGSKPVAALGGPYSSRPRELIRFDGSGSYSTEASLVSYSWAFGDGWTATGPVVNHAYEAAGTYTVTLTVRDSNGRSATGSTTAAISDGPAAEGVVWRNIVNLTAGVGGYLVKSGDYDWNAGASSRKALARGPGWFEFTLQGPSELSVAAGLGNGDSSLSPADIDFGFQIQGDAVSVIESGTARWGGWGNWYTNPSRFRVEVVEESRQPKVRYYWNGSLVYESTGTPVYPLSADVSMASDGSAIVDPVLYGVPTVSHEPIPAIAGPYGSRVGETLTFDGRGSYDSDGGSIVSYAWDFGDGAATSGPRVTHVYETPGSYGVGLTVMDNHGHSASATTTAVITGQVPAPVLSVSGGAHTNPQQVTVSSPLAGAILHYTLDGSEPSPSNAFVTSGASLPIGQAVTLKVKAFKPGWIPSDTAAATFTFAPAPPTFAPPGGSFTVPADVVIATTTDGATIRYTTNETEPTEASALYVGPIPIVVETTIKARAFKAGWPPSATVSATYTSGVARGVGHFVISLH